MKPISETVNETWSMVLAIVFAIVAFIGIVLCLWKHNALVGSGAWVFFSALLIAGGAFSSGLFTCSYLEHKGKTA